MVQGGRVVAHQLALGMRPEEIAHLGRLNEGMLVLGAGGTESQDTILHGVNHERQVFLAQYTPIPISSGDHRLLQPRCMVANKFPD